MSVVLEARLIVLLPEELLLIDETREINGAGALLELKQNYFCTLHPEVRIDLTDLWPSLWVSMVWWEELDSLLLLSNSSRLSLLPASIIRKL